MKILIYKKPTDIIPYRHFDDVYKIEQWENAIRITDAAGFNIILKSGEFSHYTIEGEFDQ